MAKVNWTDRKMMYALLLPSFIFLLIILVFPLLWAFYMSFTSYNFNKPQRGMPFEGLLNYHNLMHDPRFHTVFTNTIAYTIASVAATMILGFILAYLVYTLKSQRYSAILSSIFVLPLFVSPIVTGYSFRFMFLRGPLKQLFHGLRIFSEQPLGTQESMAVTVIADVWMWTSFAYLLILASLYAIPKYYIEASRMDGARTLSRIRHVILPQIKGLLVFALLIRVMDAFRAIDLNWTISYGGPGIANETLSLYAYRMGFSWWSIGEASALGFFMLFVTYTILLIIYRMYYGKAEVAGVVR